MSKLLRGKKLIIHHPKESFTKVPNSILFAKNLKPVEKLILIQLHYYPSNWKLAYTRMADDLSIRKDTLIKYWYSLIEKGFIISTDKTYAIDYVLLVGTNYEKRTHDGTKNVLSEGTKSVPTMVRNSSLNGTQGVPIEEETKEEDLLNKTKEEDKNKNTLNTKIEIHNNVTGNNATGINENKSSINNILNLSTESISFMPIDSSTKSDGLSSMKNQGLKIELNDVSSIKKPPLRPIQLRLNCFDDFVKIYSKEKLIEMQSLWPYEFNDIFNHLDYSMACHIHSRIKNTNWHLVDDSSINNGSSSKKDFPTQS
jgi:hypothetical protein